MNARIYVTCILFLACSSGGNDGVFPDAGTDHEAGDAPGEPPDTGSAGDVPAPATRRYTFKVVAGVSMGANAVTIAAHHPGAFDVVGSMGGYVDNRYLTHMMSHFFLGGFCPMDQVLDHLEAIDDPDEPGVFCGPVEPTMPYEFEWSFNHFHYDNSGGDWGRRFLLDIMEGFMFAFGNMMYYNPGNPLLPPGVSLEWWNDEQDKCANPAVVGKPFNFNKEYNPLGEYDLITFCDGDTVQCNENSLDCLAAKGAYEPDKPHFHPVRFMLAVDYNGNHRRDYGEPVIHNSTERFQDTGTDGCFDPYEDGKGGCLDEPTAAGVEDPNGDDFDLVENFGGTEGDFQYQDGEPYEDFGLDGVAGTGDYGEGDGSFTMNPRLERLLAQDARTYFMEAPLNELDRITWYFDGGIRDSIHALTSTMHQSQALVARGLDVRTFDDFTATKNSVLPGVPCEELMNHLDEIDFSPAGMGDNTLIRYGNPDATDSEILQGDGKHVGLACQMTNRLLVFFTLAAFRLPEPILREGEGEVGRIMSTSTWSEALQNRVRYSISLPPGYDSTKERYPLMIFLPGHGMAADAMIGAGALFNILMAKGVIPRFVVLAPEGQCCYVNRETGKRFCGCDRGKDCLDPDCKGPHESCEIVDTGPLVQECNGGHFFFNHLTNRWADPDAGEVMRFEDALFDIISDVESRFRIREPEVVEAPPGT